MTMGAKISTAELSLLPTRTPVTLPSSVRIWETGAFIRTRPPARSMTGTIRYGISEAPPIGYVAPSNQNKSCHIWLNQLLYVIEFQTVFIVSVK
jgi:hypothetical protein